MKQLVCPILVGRSRELVEAAAILDRTERGAGQMLVLTGEAGVGKSRLVAAISELAGGKGFQILTGHCLAQSRTFPYGPIVDAIRRLKRSGPGAARVFPRGPGSPLLKLLPEWDRRPDGRSRPPLDPEEERRRLIDALCAGFAALADRRPLLLVLEDVHWADEASIDFLTILAHRLTVHSLITLATYRSDEIHEHRQLQQTIAELIRKRLCDEIPLHGLTALGVGAMIQAIFGLNEPASEEFLQAVHERTEGNPFFIEELLRTLVETGGLFFTDGRWDRRAVEELEVPATIQEAILRRVAGLPEDVRRLVTLAAVLGQRFAPAPLSAAGGVDEAAALEAIRSMMNQQLVVEDRPSGGFRFRHTLTRDAIYEQLMLPERQRLHRAVAETLEQLYADRVEEHAAELALHYRLADIPERARAYALIAGDRAVTIGALAAAHNHYTGALELAVAESERGVLRHRLGRVSLLLGEMATAVAEFTESAEIFARVGDARWEARALLDLSGARLMSGDRAGSLEIRLAVLRLLEPMGESEELAAACRALGHHHMLGSAHAAAVTWAERAIQLAQASGAEQTAAEAMNDLGVALAMSGSDLPRGLALLRESLAVSRSRWVETAGRAYVNLGFVLGGLARYSEGIEVCREGLKYLTRMNAVFNRYLCQSNLGSCLRLVGQWKEAEEHIVAVLSASEALLSKKFRLTGLEELVLLRADQGRWAEAGQMLEELEPLAIERDELQHICTLRLTRARLNAAQGNLDGAWHELRLLREYWKERTDDPVLIAPALAFACSLAAAQGEASQAEVYYADLEAIAARSPSPETRACLDHAVGDLAAARQDRGEASAALRRAADAWGVLDRPYDHARALRGLGQVLLSGGGAADRVEAQRVLDEAYRTFRDLGAADELGETEAVLRRAGLSIRRGPRRATRQAPGGLTGRELEVTRLVAAGRTNADIAKALYITPKTAAIHVSNVLSKLGFSHRAEIARWAAEHHLASREPHESPRSPSASRPG